MILSKEVELHWVGNIRDEYIEKGYKYTKNKEPFTVKIEDLNSTSSVKILVKCDDCGELFERNYSEVYNKESHYCRKCSYKHIKKKEYNKIELKDMLLNVLNNKFNGNIPKGFVHIFNKENGLYDWGVYKKVFNIKTMEELLNEINFKIKDEDLLRLRQHTKINYTKNQAKEIILKMQSKIDRPLMYDDFRDTKLDEVGIITIRKYWAQ